MQVNTEKGLRHFGGQSIAGVHKGGGPGRIPMASAVTVATKSSALLHGS